MHIFSWRNHKCKFLGLSLFKVKIKNGYFYIYLFGIPLYRYGKQIIALMDDVNNNTHFDTSFLDKKIESFLPTTYFTSVHKKNNKIAFLATQLYDIGGHTKCIKDLIKSLTGIYDQKLFLTQKNHTFNFAPYSTNFIRQFASIYGVDAIGLEVNKLVKQIIHFAPKTLLVYIHPNDIFGTAVLTVIRKSTNIKIIFFNHASHYPVLGMSFAHLILEGMPTTEKITREKRKFNNTKIIGLQSLAKNETVYLSKDTLDSIKEKLSITKNNLVTMSGASSYKFFEDNDSPYFKMIKRLLIKEVKLVHVVISIFSNEQASIINSIFDVSEDIKSRLIILPYQREFDSYFQCADVFIDSFPIASALTQIDLMRNKVASVVKINKEIPQYSFHEYQMPNYPYMFEEVEDMEKAILYLLHNPNKREEVVNTNYNFWLKTYESSVVRDKYIKIIEEDQNGDH